MEYTTGSVVFGDWVITREIGEGATGKVFEIEKSDFSAQIKSALKVVHIPKSESDIRAVMGEGMDEESVAEYFQGFVDEILQEIKTMVSLKGHPNIVTYEDHCVVPQENGIGWDILIKMELLTPLSEWIRTHSITEEEVIRLGCEISDALAYTSERGLMHRDVKPANIFVDDFGRFKLGDFGIARTIEKTTIVFSKKGTESYMAPEVYLGKKYNKQVDIYSLGMVLYRFLNENRLPFYPPYPQPITYKDREEAVTKRINGKEIPEPINGSAELKKIVLKACKYRPQDRYASAKEMQEALQMLNIEKKKTGNTNNKKYMIGLLLLLAGISAVAVAGKFKSSTNKVNRVSEENEISEKSKASEENEVNKESNVIEESEASKENNASEKNEVSDKNNENEKSSTVEGISLTEEANGYFKDKNYEKAVELYQRAAEKEDAEAIYQLGVCYQNGYGVEANEEKALELVETAAQKGYGYAEYDVGYMYFSGTMGYEQNYEEAVKWFEKAAKQNIVEAQANLGVCYIYGFGTDVDEKKGIEFLKEAADQENGPAEYTMGSCYQDGLGVDVDIEQARYWYQRAAEHGVEAADAALEELSSVTTSESQNTEQTYSETGMLHTVKNGDTIESVTFDGGQLSIPLVMENGELHYDCIGFGNYPQDDTSGEESSVIAWRVVKFLEGDGIVYARLVADCNLDVCQYDESEAAEWENSYLKKWLNDTFFEKAFTEKEKSVIVAEDYEDQLISIPSVADVNQFTEDFWTRNNTAYVAAGGTVGSTEMNQEGTPGWYWLKDSTENGAMRYTNGQAEEYYANSSHGAVCPTMWVNLTEMFESFDVTD